MFLIAILIMIAGVKAEYDLTKRYHRSYTPRETKFIKEVRHWR